MNVNPWLRSALGITIVASVFAMAGCNLFNPGGEGDGGTVNPAAAGDEYIRRGEYAKALAAFDRAIRRDSTNSYAYVGYATAATLLYKLDHVGILNDMQATAEDPETFAFLQHEDSILTLRLQAASNVRRVLGLLTDRDTLTRWYGYLTDSTSEEARQDAAYDQRRLFIEDYLVKADLGIPGYRKRGKFPLTDFSQPFTFVILDYRAFDLLYTITRLYDFDRNDTIDHRDALAKKLKFGSKDGGFGIDSLSKIAGDLENDTAAAGNMNALIAGMQAGLVSSSELAGFGGDGDSSGSSDEEQSENLDNTIASMGDAIMFYQFGDKLDNDGDGCVDEEILDDVDNDLDGYVDEDARVIPGTRPDLVDNDNNGLMDPYFVPTNTNLATVDSAEGVVGDTVYPARPYVLGFVYRYLLSNDDGQDESGASVNATTWVRIKRNDPSSEKNALRLNIQKDSLVVRIKANGGVVPDSLQAKLQTAKTEIGGCWRNF